MTIWSTIIPRQTQEMADYNLLTAGKRALYFFFFEGIVCSIHSWQWALISQMDIVAPFTYTANVSQYIYIWCKANKQKKNSTQVAVYNFSEVPVSGLESVLCAIEFSTASDSFPAEKILCCDGCLLCFLFCFFCFVFSLVEFRCTPCTIHNFTTESKRCFVGAFRKKVSIQISSWYTTAIPSSIYKNIGIKTAYLYTVSTVRDSGSLFIWREYSTVMGERHERLH